MSLVIFFFSICHSTFAGLPSESIQLQMLVNKAEEQVQAARETLKYSKNDARSLAQVEQALERLSAGLDQSVKKYQGTNTYEKALLQLQNEAGFISGHERAGDPLTIKKIERFQQTSVSANAADLENQDKLQSALSSAQPGFVPKVQAQAQLGNWQTNIRSSAQLTQILSTLNGLRNDLNGRGEGSQGGLNTLLNGAQIQNAKLRGKAINEPR